MEKLTNNQSNKDINDQESATDGEIHEISVAKSQVILKAREEAEGNYKEWREALQFVHDIPEGLSPQEYHEAKNARMRILRCRKLGLSDDATDEEIQVARKEERKLQQLRSYGLPDNATDQELENAMSYFDVDNLKEVSEEEKESRKMLKREYEKKAKLGLPATATIEEVEYRNKVRDEEFNLGINKLIY